MRWTRRNSFACLALATSIIASGLGYQLLLRLECTDLTATVITNRGFPTMSWLLIGGFVILALLALLPWIFKLLDLADKAEALGLPDGSVRAVIAVTLLALFAVTPLYLFQGIAAKPHEIAGLSQPAMEQAIAAHQAEHPDAKKIAEPAADGKPSSESYTVSYYAPADSASVDFAKQLLVLLGTLATAVASFYFGAAIATSANAQGAGQAAAAGSQLKPSLLAVTAPAAAIVRAADGSVSFDLTVTGANLNNVKTLKLVCGNEQHSFTPTTNDNSVTCKIEFTPATPVPAAWTIIVVDGAGTASDPLTGKLSF